jgi:translation initiation factor IF-1
VDPDRARSAGGRAPVARDVRESAGVVMETLPSAMYRVRLDDGPLVVAHIADRIDRNFVRLLVGDRVRVELSPVDVGRGRIVEKL